MLQRNPGPHPLVLPTLDPPREIEEGETIEHPTLLVGFEPLPDQHSASGEGEPPGQHSDQDEHNEQATGELAAPRPRANRRNRRDNENPETTA